MSKYSEDLKKIVGISEILKAIDQLKEKADLKNERGLAIMDADGNIVGYQGENGDDSLYGLLFGGQLNGFKGSEKYDKESEAENPNAPAQPRGRPGRPQKPGDDAADGGAFIDPTTQYLGNKLGELEQKISELNNITDPYYGQALKVLLQPNHYPPLAGTIDAGANRDSSAWTGPDDPPVVASYEAGKYWTIISGATQIYAQTFEDMVSQREALDGTYCYEVEASAPYNIISVYPHAGSAYIMFANTPGLSVGDPAGGGTQYNYDTSGAIGAGKYGKETCGGDAGADATCALDAPTEASWPTNHTTTLALDADGLFKSNTYDISNAGKAYRDGVTTLVYKYTDPTDGVTVRHGVIEPTASGDLLIFGVDSQGAPRTDAKLLSKDMSGGGKDLYVGGGSSIREPSIHKVKQIIPQAEVNKYRYIGAGNKYVRIDGNRIK